MNSNNVFIDYTKVETGGQLLGTVEGSTKKIIDELETTYQSLVKLGNSHDNCFSKISIDSVVQNFKTVDSNISHLSLSMLSLVMFFSFAENCTMDNYNISSKGLDKINLTGIYEDKLKNNAPLKAGYNAEYYNDLLKKKLSQCSDSDTRAKVVTAATFLAIQFPKMNYFWGGGHDKISEGVDPNWGQPKRVTAAGSDTTGTDQPSSLDCSGYVSWALKNGGYNLNGPMVVSGLKTLGNCESITNTTSPIEVGDLAYIGDEHIGIVLAKTKNTITVSHSRGNGHGMSLTTVDTTTGLVVSDATDPTQVGKSYFTGITHIDYT